MIVDTSALLAYFDAADPRHADCAKIIDAATEDLVVSPYVLAEVDYLVATRVGVAAELAVLAELSAGAWELATLGVDELPLAAAVIEKYADQEIGLADASNVVLADRYRTRTIATLDHRHFDVLRPLGGGRFKILP